MKSVLFLAYHFPPTGGAGAQRSTKFVRALPQLGYRATVICAHAPPGPWTPRDRTLLDELSGDADIRHLAAAAPAGRRVDTALRRWAGAGSRQGAWWVNEAVAASEDAEPVDLVYASMSPFETAAAAGRVAARLDVPWVADLRDPWAIDEMRMHPTLLHRRLDLRRMRRDLASAAAVVVNTPEARERVGRALPSLADRLVVIPNGWDADDFRAVPGAPSPTGFRIVHTGSLHTHHARRRVWGRARRALGGDVGVDLMCRTHVHLLEAIRRVREAAPSLASGIEVHLAGAHSAADRAVQDRAIRYHGYLDHAASVTLLRSADLLFLPMHDLPAGHRATIVPGKTYEYLASDRPILAAVPEGDARDLVATMPGAYVCRPRDVAAMAAIVEMLAERKRSAGPEPDALRPGLDRFERGHLAADLARVFDGVLGDPAAPVRAERSGRRGAPDLSARPSAPRGRVQPRRAPDRRTSP